MNILRYLYQTQPKGLAILGLTLTLELAKAPFWALLYLAQSLRQHPNWTFRQAISVRLWRSLLHSLSKGEILFPTHLHPAAEGARFKVLSPGPAVLYQGPLHDAAIKPARVGGTWFPTPYPPLNPSKSTEKVVLHLHGGAFIYGTGRDDDSGASSRWLLDEGGFARVFALQYRLAGGAHGTPFPAALQDVVTGYRYLLQQLRIPAANIVLSGDSAGGNLAVALLRYVAEHGEKAGLPAPSAALLWSPWVDVAVNVDVDYFNNTPQYPVDYLTGLFGNWGLREYAGRRDPREPYITPSGHPFFTPTPIWLQTGDSEVLFTEDVAFQKEMRTAGTRIEIHIEEGAVHDIFALAKTLGFEREAKSCIRKAGEWYRRL